MNPVIPVTYSSNFHLMSLFSLQVHWRWLAEFNGVIRAEYRLNNAPTRERLYDGPRAGPEAAPEVARAHQRAMIRP